VNLPAGSAPDAAEIDALGALPPPPLAAADQTANADEHGALAATESVQRSGARSAMGAILPQGEARRFLVWETRFVMWAFLFPAVMGAVIVLAQHVEEVGNITRFSVIVHGHPVTNLILGIFDYVAVAAVVPLALFLLDRTGQSPAVMGLGVPRLKRDIWPGLGLAAGAFATEVVILIPFASFMKHHSSLATSVGVGNVPKYYVIGGLAMSAITAIAEEVLVNGYLITRLGQLGWTPRKSLILSLILRTSYHVYYGLGFLLTIPFGFFVTRSFQKHHKLNRPIMAHFLYDAVLITIAILK
jgi:membrane protease YdiL (CAAX protease family)